MAWTVTWDGPQAGRRAHATWPDFENARTHAHRKAAAGLNPEIEPAAEEIDDELAAQRLADQP